LGTECGRGAYDSTKVARIGDRVERDNERLADVQRGSHQIVGMQIVEGSQVQGHALMHRSAGQPVQLGPGHLEQGRAAIGRQLQNVAKPIVAFGSFGHVAGLDRNVGLHRLQHRVAAHNPFGP
jgi:hypothetical protein